MFDEGVDDHADLRRERAGHRPDGMHGDVLDEAIRQHRVRIVVQGLSIGHRRAFERMNQAIEALVIDKVYGFDQVPQAFEHLEKGPFGKVVIATS